MAADGVKNWQAVGPRAKEKLKGILQWNRKTAHPHTQCVAALAKKGIPPERANKICAVAKDMALKRTTWREGGKRRD